MKSVILSIGLAMASAAAAAPVFAPTASVIPFESVAPESLRAADAVCSVAGVRDKVASDYDCLYYWLSSDGLISNTWETSIVEIVESDVENEYLIKNFLADTFRPEQGADFTTDDIRVVHDPQSGALTIACGQPLFVRSEGGLDMQICIYSLKRGEKGWMLGLDGDMVLASTETGFALAEISEVQGFYIGCYNEATKRFSGYGGVLYPEFCEFNGVMLYQVTADENTEMIPWLNDIYTEVSDIENMLSIRNFANFGYDVQVNFTYDLATGKALAINPLLGVLYDTAGVQNPYYACNADAAGTALRDAGGRYVLTADISTDALGNSVLSIPLWGAFIGEQWVGLYGNTSAMLFIKLPEAAAGTDVRAAVPSDGDTTPQYFDLQGRAVDFPQPGSFVICRRGSVVTKQIIR